MKNKNTLTGNGAASKGKRNDPFEIVKTTKNKSAFRVVKASPSQTKIKKNLIQEAVENAISGK
jgi:uncharacterized protein with ATP-grasp and redox domains